MYTLVMGVRQNGDGRKSLGFPDDAIGEEVYLDVGCCEPQSPN
jgi:hypothetical protein